MAFLGHLHNTMIRAHVNTNAIVKCGKLYQGAHAHPSLGQSFGISSFPPLSRVLCLKMALKGSKNYEALSAPGWIFQSS
jgi:hypothetical protein